MNVQVIDCNYWLPQFAAVFLIVQKGRAILIENNTEKCIPAVEKALASHGLGFDSIDFLFVTHAHLDHAAGSGRFLELCPKAVLCSHPKAINHLVDPTKLIAGARQVYGELRFNDLYGAVKPCQPTRTRSMADGERIQWQGLEFEFVHTRGHANHHACIIERTSASIFTGDTFGLCYPSLQSGGLFIFPTTSPTGFEPEEAIKSVARIASLRLSRAYLTHFGLLTEIEAAAKQLITDLDVSHSIVKAAALLGAAHDTALKDFCFQKLEPYLNGRLKVLGILNNAERYVSPDVDLNAAGMAVAALYLRKRASA